MYFLNNLADLVLKFLKHILREFLIQLIRQALKAIY